MRRFGREGEKLHALTHGIFDWKRTGDTPGGPVQTTTVLPRDITDQALLRSHIRFTVDKLCHRLAAQNACTASLTCRLTYTDNRTVQKTMVFAVPTGDFTTLCRRVSTTCFQLYRRRVGIKSLHLLAKRLRPPSGQLSLFDDTHTRKQRMLSAGITRIRKKMRFEVVLNGACIASGCS